MEIKRPKCHSDYSDSHRFCAECWTQIIPAEDISVSRRKTLQTPNKELIRETRFSGKHEIIRTLNLSFKTKRSSPSKNHKFFIIQRNS